MEKQIDFKNLESLTGEADELRQPEMERKAQEDLKAR